jgi:hypothetical protein
MKQNKEIICVYQDCPLCGSKGQEILQSVFEKGATIRKVSFASEEGKDLIHKAVFEHKIGQMPFFTDGQRFSTNVDDILAEPTKKPAKKSKKVKEGEDGLDK